MQKSAIGFNFNGGGATSLVGSPALQRGFVSELDHSAARRPQM